MSSQTGVRVFPSPDTISLLPRFMGRGAKRGATHYFCILVATCVLGIHLTNSFPVRAPIGINNNNQTRILRASSEATEDGNSITGQRVGNKFTLDTSDKSYTQLACLQLKTCQSCTADPDCGWCVEYNGDATPQFTTTCMQSNENGVVTGAGEDGPDCKEMNRNFFYNNCIGYVKEN